MSMSTFVYRKDNEDRRPSDRRLNRLRSYAVFMKEIIVNPRAIGAACPSSPYLAKAMAAMVDGRDSEGLVVELGGGTGAITHALLQQGVAPGRLVTIERSPALAAHLREKFPEIRVIEGDAARMQELLGADSERVRAVVSGLPLRSLPAPTVQRIIQQVRALLRTDGTFVQFTYDLRAPSIGQVQSHSHIDTKIVWKNIPPARVDAYSGPTM